MALNAAKKKPTGNKDFVEQEPIDEGTYPCRVAQIIELGLQPQRPHQGKVKPPVEMLYVTYELTDEFMLDKDGEEVLNKPRWQSEDFPFYGLDCDMAKCNKRIKAIDPKLTTGGDWALLGGFPCLVTFVHNTKGDKTFINVASVASVRAKDAGNIAELQNPVKIFDLDEPDLEVFNALPTWLQDKIKSNLNYKGSILEGMLGAEQEEEEDEPEEAPKKPAKKSRKPVPQDDDEDDEPDGDVKQPWDE